MSPILFNLFVNDINEIFDVRFCHPVSLGNINLHAYCQKWELMVNNKKTKIMAVEKRQSSAQIHRFSFQKEPLEICKLYP